MGRCVALQSCHKAFIYIPADCIEILSANMCFIINEEAAKKDISIKLIMHKTENGYITPVVYIFKELDWTDYANRCFTLDIKRIFENCFTGDAYELEIYRPISGGKVYYVGISICYKSKK